MRTLGNSFLRRISVRNSSLHTADIPIGEVSYVPLEIGFIQNKLLHCAVLHQQSCNTPFKTVNETEP